MYYWIACCDSPTEPNRIKSNQVLLCSVSQAFHIDTTEGDLSTYYGKYRHMIHTPQSWSVWKESWFIFYSLYAVSCSWPVHGRAWTLYKFLSYRNYVCLKKHYERWPYDSFHWETLLWLLLMRFVSLIFCNLNTFHSNSIRVLCF